MQVERPPQRIKDPVLYCEHRGPGKVDREKDCVPISREQLDEILRSLP